MLCVFFLFFFLPSVVGYTFSWLFGANLRFAAWLSANQECESKNSKFA